jgi:hypothetical protein
LVRAVSVKEMPNPELHPSFVEALREDREALNARFATRRLAGEQLDGDVLTEHLRTAVEPLVRAVHGVLPERARGIVAPLFDASLDLLAATLVGPQAKSPYATRVWRELLPAAARVLAREPLRVAGCLSNAIAHLTSQRGARPETWIERMTAVAPHCQSVSQLLDCGKVAAWLAGAVQYRAAALRTALTLPPPLALRVLGLPLETPADALSAVIQSLQNNPWLTVQAALHGGSRAASLEYVGQAGAFRGFGGEFLRPPTVTLAQGCLLASDGQSTWQIFADAYGTLLHRVVGGPQPSPESKHHPEVTVQRDGTVRWGSLSAKFAHLAAPRSFAGDGATLAVTTATSHHVFLIGMTGGTA